MKEAAFGEFVGGICVGQGVNGGSTNMFLDGKVVNKPSDKEGERKVGDTILVFPRMNK
jgi:hypothetical protein